MPAPQLAPGYRAFKKLNVAYAKIRHTRFLNRFFLSHQWWIVLFVLLLPLLYVTVLVVIRSQTTYHLYTGPAGGTNAALGPGIADAINKPTVWERFTKIDLVPRVVPQESCGALDNIYFINTGRAQLALAEDGLPLHFEQPRMCSLDLQRHVPRENQGAREIRLRALMPLYKSPLHIVARKNLEISDVRQIKPHAKVYMGPDGGATAFLAQLILDHYAIPVERVNKNLNFKQAMQQIINGQIDIAFFLVGLNSEAVRPISQYEHLTLLTIEHAVAITVLYPYLEVVSIPASTYKVSSSEITTLGTKTILVVSTDLSDNQVYQIASKLAGSIHDLLRDVPLNATKITESTPQKELYYPLHDGAVRFFSHNPPFFLDPHTLAEIGTYLSVLFAAYKLSMQFLRNYRVHRLLHAVDRAEKAFKISPEKPKVQRYQWYLVQIRKKALGLLRHERLTMEDFSRINEYVKGHAGE
jgi:hypothetical protein